ncbi:transmembrane protein, putative, partial [Bodo saltans]
MLKCLLLHARKKGGQQSWTPSATASGVSPSVGLSGYETLNLIHRPLPLDDVVDYEEDFGPSIVLQREYFPKRLRDRLAFDIAPLAYSDLELRKAKEQLASQMNKELYGANIPADTPNDVPFMTSVDPDTREVTSARYLFNDERMAFCERFDQFFGTEHQLFSLMEASAVLHGCDNDNSKEAYLKLFLNLDRDTIDDEVERLRSCRTDLKDANEMLKQRKRMLTDDEDDDEAAEGEDGAAKEAAQKLPNEFLEYAPLVKSYLAHAQGQSRTVSADVSSVGSSERVANKVRWRQLLLKIAEEDYHKLNAVEMSDARALNDQLHTTKFFDLKLGDVVREIVHRTKRSTTGGSLHGGSQLDRSASHPEGRSSDMKSDAQMEFVHSYQVLKFSHTPFINAALLQFTTCLTIFSKIIIEGRYSKVISFASQSKKKHTKNQPPRKKKQPATMFRIGRNPSNAGAFLLWASLSTATLIVQIICDLYQEAAPEFPLPPLLLQSVISVVAASGLVIASGRRSYPNSFHYYQPFVGGDTFTAMQILGYLSVASGVLINIGFWKVQHTSTFRGVLSCAGVLMVFGNVMLMSSLDHYKTKCDARLSTSPAARSVSPKCPTAPQSKNIYAEATQQHLRHPPPLKLNTALPPQLPFLASPANRTMLLVIFMCILGNTAPAAIATMVPSVADLVMSVQLVLHVLAALLVHVVIGCRHTPEYRLFMPVPRGSFKLAFTQGFAWFTFSIGLQGSLFVIRTGTTVDFFFHLIYAVSITSAVSIFSLLLFVRMWPFHKRASIANDAGRGGGRSPVEQEASPLQLNSARSYRTGTTEYFIVHHGRFTASFVAVLGSLFVISISYVRLYPDHIREYVSTDFFVSSTVVEGMRVCQLVTILFLLALPPLTHSIGALIFPGEFDLWAPFTGSKVYIALQALGWTVHTLSVICAVAVMSTGPESAVVFACLLSFSQLFIHASLHVFEPNEASFDNRPLSPRRGPQSPRSSSTVLRTLNGELMLSVVLAVGGLTLRFLAYLSDVLPRDPLLWFATLSLVLAAPLAHLSIRFRNGPLLSPFQGPPEFVALQAVGWTLYTLSLVLEGIRFAEGRGFDTQHSWTIESLMYLVPYSMVAFSAVLWKGETTEEPERVVLSPTRRRSAFDDRVPAASEDSWKSTTSQESMMYHAKQLLDELSRDNAAQDRFPELQHQLSLFVRQRGKEQGPQRSDSPGNSPSSSKSISPSHGPLRIAGITVATLSISEVLLYVLAALYSTDSHRGATAVVLTVSGMICATLTSFSVHLIVGPLVYPDTYHRFMPFSGGGSFVVLQACGSVGLFAAAERSAASNAAPSLLEVHAEGSVAVLLFLATFTLHHIHENVSTFVNDAIGPVVVLLSTTSVMLALPLSAVALRKTRRPASSPKLLDDNVMNIASLENESSLDSVMLALPLSAVALRKTRRPASSPKLLDDNVMNIASLENESSLDATPTKKKPTKATNKHRPSSSGADRSNEDKSDDSTMEYFVIPIMTSFPVGELYVGYFTLNHYTVYATMVLQGVLYGFYALMALIVVLIVSRSSAFGHTLKELRKTSMTWILYMIPTIIVLPSYLVPLLFPCRSTMLW